jgi:putative ABC transport system permease protein
VSWEIVGVPGDAINSGAGRPVEPEVIVPFTQTPVPRAIVAVHTTGEDAGLLPAIAGVLTSLDPRLPMADVRTIEQTLSLSFAADRFYTVFIAAFAAVALLLAAVGIYGVMSFVVARRTHEIGVRIALGGRRGQVLAHILREGMTTALAGTAIGVVGASLMGRVLEGAVYGARTTSPLTFLVVAATLLAAAVIACLVPARRAAAVDPMVALRQQ